MRRAATPHMTVAALSHAGGKRTNNEDRYSVTPFLNKGTRTPCLLAIVADGIGGHVAGEVASQLTVDAIVRSIAASDGRNPVTQLGSAVVDAAHAVADAAQQAPEHHGMGSTVVAVWILGDRLHTAYVGDSRIYLLRESELLQLTTDHTWVQEAIEHEIISPEEARSHPHAHVLRRAIGSPQTPEPDMRIRLPSAAGVLPSEANQGLRLQPSDRILLCSDGLTDLVSNREIKELLAQHSPDQAVRKLVDLALARGGHDNVTVVVLAPRRARRRLRLLRAPWIVLAGLGFGLLTLAAIIAALVISLRMGLWSLPWAVPTPTTSAAGSETFSPQLALTPTPFPPLASGTSADVPLAATHTSTPIPLATIAPLPTTSP